MKNHTFQKSIFASPLALICNLLLVYVLYGLCRLVYLFENWSVITEGFASLSCWQAFKGCWMFDTSAILYTNALYALMMLVPLHYKERNAWQLVCKGVFVAVNGLCIVINIADSVWFQYTGRRAVWSLMSEFSNEGNVGSIVGVELLRHWYLLLAGIVLIALMWRAYVKPAMSPLKKSPKDYALYYGIQLVCLALFIPICICGMRGGATTAVRPITLSNANQYVNRSAEAACILNTPFSLIRSIGKNAFQDPKYFTREQLDSLYQPLQRGMNDGEMKQKNVVVLIVESYGREYLGAYNERLDGGKYKGYAPFTDSLIAQSLTFDYTFANGRKSIDAMPSILSSIPHFIEPFFLTPASLNKVSSLAGELGKMGWQSAFFHGAENGSMGFEAFARAAGYDRYFGRTEYNQDKRFHGDKDFDGMWAIWDEEFLQFYALQMSEMKEPFVTTVFTASSHQPYEVPERYKNIYKNAPGDDNRMHKCVSYVDNALRLFFNTAKQQPWYKNTIFVLTSDHTNLSSRAEYQTDLGVFGAPLLIFDPSGEIKADRRHCIAQQIDIMPTVLNYLGYPHPYVAFGCDLMSTPDSLTWAVNNTAGFYQYVKGDYVLQFTNDGQTKGLYNYKNDWFMRHNLLEKKPQEKQQMEHELKAIIQSYMERMVEDRLTFSSE